jgi:hypothetical protein
MIFSDLQDDALTGHLEASRKHSKLVLERSRVNDPIVGVAFLKGKYYIFCDVGNGMFSKSKGASSIRLLSLHSEIEH